MSTIVITRRKLIAILSVAVAAQKAVEARFPEIPQSEWYKELERLLSAAYQGVKFEVHD